jgi:hypothetical protein
MRISTILLVLAAAAPCAAQSTSKSLPAELVTALFAGGQAVGRGATYSVEELPAGWPAALIPPGSSPAGGMAYGHTLVALFADTARNPVASYVALLGSAGFSQPSPRRGSGFMSSSGPYSWYCRDSTSVVARMAPAPASTRWLRVSYTASVSTPCVRPEPAEPSTPRSRSILALPELPPPASLGAGRAGSGASEESVTSYTMLSGTSMTPAALVEHYTALLTAAGWTASATASDSASAVQLLRAHDANGRLWHGALFVHATTTGRNAFLEMKAENAR